jgi:hypothetical protein
MKKRSALDTSMKRQSANVMKRRKLSVRDKKSRKLRD